jgi:hypothetical protein
MRVLVILKAKARSEAGALPAAEHVAAIGKFHDELVKAGVVLAGGALHPSNLEDMVAGFWIWQVKSMDEALEWVRRYPAPPGAGDGVELELRPIRSGMFEA